MLSQANWTNNEIRMLHILGATIGIVLGFMFVLMSHAQAVDQFPWRLMVVTGAVVGSFIGAFNRAPLVSCLGALLFGALLGAVAGLGYALISGTVLWLIFWKFNLPGISTSAKEFGALIGGITGVLVIDPRLWYRLCLPFRWIRNTK